MCGMDYLKLGTTFPYEKAFRTIVQRADKHWRALVGCGHRELAVLLCVTEGCNQKDLVIHMGLHPNVIVKLLDGMEKAELLRRRRKREDRREHSLEITSKGLLTLQTFHKHRPRLLLKIFAPLTMPQIEQWKELSIMIVRGELETHPKAPSEIYAVP